MAKLLVVVGLPASGKSNFIVQMKYPGLVIAHDFFLEACPPQKSFTDAKDYPKLIHTLRAGTDCLISDVKFCDSWWRAQAEAVVAHDVPGTRIEWVFFANDPDQCLENSRERARQEPGRRNPAEEAKVIRELTRKYIAPVGVPVLPVWKKQ